MKNVVEVCFVWFVRNGSSVDVRGYDGSGRRKVYRMCEENVREKLVYFMKERMLLEFIGCGWRCVWENGRYWWSKVRELDVYEDDLCVDD